MPRYKGELKTNLRFRLIRGGKEDDLFSNEFEGSVNPDQFTKKEGHQPTDVMDPYND